MKVTVAIVDDEPLARDRLRRLVSAEPDLEIVAECASGPEAVEALNSLRPDLVLLDIHLPGLSGFEVLEALPPPLPVVIFITAFDEHAVQAFEAQALDYLLKPFKPARLQTALARARERLRAGPSGDVNRRLLEFLAQPRPPAPAYLSRVAVRERQRVRFIRTGEIDWIEASGNYVVLHAGKEEHLVRETLAAFEAQLSPAEFVRISRSAIVRLDRVQHLEPAFNNEHVVVLAGGLRLPMTRGLRELQERLKFS